MKYKYTFGILSCKLFAHVHVQYTHIYNLIPLLFLESSIPVRVIQPNLHRRSLSSAEDLTLKFRISSQPVILKLHHNAQVNSPIPIYVISQNGSVIREHLFNGSEVS